MRDSGSLAPFSSKGSSVFHAFAGRVRKRCDVGHVLIGRELLDFVAGRYELDSFRLYPLDEREPVQSDFGPPVAVPRDRVAGGLVQDLPAATFKRRFPCGYAERRLVTLQERVP